MTQTIRKGTPAGQHSGAGAAGTAHGITAKGLKGGQLGLLAVVVLGISTIAPAYTLTSALGPTINEAGLQLPVIFLIGFIPMILVSLAYPGAQRRLPGQRHHFHVGHQSVWPLGRLDGRLGTARS